MFRETCEEGICTARAVALDAGRRADAGSPPPPPTDAGTSGSVDASLSSEPDAGVDEDPLDAGTAIVADAGSMACPRSDGGGFSTVPKGDASQPPSCQVPPQPCTTDAECAAGDFCDGPSCSGAGTCRLALQICPALYDPVCGCDGQQYSSACHARSAGVRIAAHEPCP